MYNKVDTNMNFVDREKNGKNSGAKNDTLKKPWRTVRKARYTIFFMTDRLRQRKTVISVMWRRVRSRI